MHFLLALLSCAFAGTQAGPVCRTRPVNPAVAGTPRVLGLVDDPALNRDSCTSTRVGSRQLWTCRDTNAVPGAPRQFFYGSTASWSETNPGGGTKVKDGNLTCYGRNRGAYFEPAPPECGGPAGSCPDDSRWVIWPDSPPLPVDDGRGGTTLYTWIKNVHWAKNGQLGPQLNPNPPTSLYRSHHSAREADPHALPPTTLVKADFHAAGRPGYGNYGWVLHRGTAYLYAQLNCTTAPGAVALARAPAARLDDAAAYEYYQPRSGRWAAGPAPRVDDAAQAVPHAGTGQQGTFYHSRYFGAFVWIGAPALGASSTFQIATAPAPEGPWTEPVDFYTAPPGKAFPGYSQQAHPGLSEDMGHGRDIYLTFTKVDDPGNGLFPVYETPLIRVQWQ